MYVIKVKDGMLYWNMDESFFSNVESATVFQTSDDAEEARFEWFGGYSDTEVVKIQ